MKVKYKFMYNDWVMVDGKFYQIQSWTKKKIGIHKTPTAMSYVRLHDVQPIILTKDILLMNGFQEIDNYQGYASYYNYTDKAGIQFNGKCFYVVLNNVIRTITYLHELQHMYEWIEIERNWIVPQKNLEN
jgi:hypothetical protein